MLVCFPGCSQSPTKSSLIVPKDHFKLQPHSGQLLYSTAAFKTMAVIASWCRKQEQAVRLFVSVEHGGNLFFIARLARGVGSRRAR